MENLLTTSPRPVTFCSDLSREAGESMIGTASTVYVWFLLEYSGPWNAQATDDNDLPRPVQTRLAEQLQRVENGRVQFIKQDISKVSDGLTFLVALSQETGSKYYRFELKDYQDLLSLDVPALLSGRGAYQEYKGTELLYLVCTNGKRDRCCSREGLATYQGLSQHVGEAVWQTTHLGGHRFAPTVVTLPDGMYYGRLAQPDLARFVKANELNEIYLSHLRGRGCFDKVTQAAEYFLRQKTGVRQRSAFRLLDAYSQGKTRWLVRFHEMAVGDIHRVILSRELTAAERVVSCSPMKRKPVVQIQFVSLETEGF